MRESQRLTNIFTVNNFPTKMSCLLRTTLTTLLALFHFVVVGHVFSFGFLVDPFERAFTITNGSTVINSTELTLTYVSSIGTVQLGLFMGLQFISALAFYYRSAVTTNYLPEIFIMMGIVFWFVGTFAATYTTTGPQLFGVYSVLTGVGGSLIYWTTLALAGIMPTNKSGMPSNKTTVLNSKSMNSWPLTIVIVSGGLSQLFYSLVVAQYYTTDQVLWVGMEEQAWRVALRYVALIGVSIMTVAIILLMMIRWNIICTSKNNGSIEQAPLMQESAQFQGSLTKPKGGERAVCCNFTTYAILAYVLLVLTVVFSGYAMYAPYVHLVEYLLSMDTPLTTIETTYVVTTIGVMSVVGRLVGAVLQTALAQCGVKSHMYWPGMLLFVQAHNAVVIGCWQVITSYAGAIVFAVFFGLGFGLSLASIIMITADYGDGIFSNTKGVQNTYALYLIPISLAMSISVVGAGTVFGAIYDSCNPSNTGYICAINAALGMQAAALVCSAFVFLLLWVSVGKLRD